MKPYKCAKNVILAGATDYRDRMTDFSCWGPTGDGRLRPDVVAKGDNLVSPTSNNTYGVYSGTSMAAPVVTGGLALLLEHYNNLYNGSLTPAQARALIAISAKDLGRKGPDYSYGFGLFDVTAATEIITAHGKHNLILSDSVRKVKKKKNRRPVYYRFEVPSGVKLLKVILCWADPPGPILTNKSKSVLVNDLDIKLYWIKEKKKRTRVKTYEPWILDPLNPANTAKRGTNSIDNIEMVEVNRPKKGTWYIEVNGTKFGEGRKQDFALIVYTDSPIEGSVEKADQPNILE
jgi:hypothetical protein